MSNEFANFLITKEIRFKHARGMRDIIGKELHVYHEILFFINGDTEFTSEYGRKRLSPHTAIVIPKNSFHCLTLLGEESEYERCVLNFDRVAELDEIIDDRMKNIFLVNDERITDIFRKMSSLLTKPLPKNEKDIMLKALIASLLVILKPTEDRNFDFSTSHYTSRIISYINKNIGSDLSAKRLASMMHISESHLLHTFKKDLHIPLHRYILEKRLICADGKIKNGSPAMQAALECGFSDYSGFYKQYKKMFGEAPTHMENAFPSQINL